MMMLLGLYGFMKRAFLARREVSRGASDRYRHDYFQGQQPEPLLLLFLFFFVHVEYPTRRTSFFSLSLHFNMRVLGVFPCVGLALSIQAVERRISLEFYYIPSLEDG